MRIASVAVDLAFSSKSRSTRVAIVHNLDTTANFYFEGVIVPRILNPASIPSLTLPQHLLTAQRILPSLNFPPTNAPQAGILEERGLRGSRVLASRESHVLGAVPMAAAAARRFTFSTFALSKRSFDLLCFDDARSGM